jgi:hypothetical protein
LRSERWRLFQSDLDQRLTEEDQTQFRQHETAIQHKRTRMYHTTTCTWTYQTHQTASTRCLSYLKRVGTIWVRLKDI